MILHELEVRDFRNYRSLQLSLSPDVNIFVGQNAQGKTNVLESVSMLALAKSHRTHRDAEMIRWEAEKAYIAGRLTREERTYVLDLTLLPKGKKARVNQVEKRKISDFVGHLNIVLFAPEDLMLVKGGPQARRRFLDVEIGQVSPHYLYNLTQYARVLLQRNNLLKEAGKGGRKTELIQMLSIWDEQLSVYAAKIIQKRVSFLERLQTFASEIHRRITGGQEDLQLRYHSVVYQEDLPPTELPAHIFAELQKKQKHDLERGTTSLGPHRDDIGVWINGRDVHTYGSQGQQRTAALSMKLAEIELIRHEVGEYPVLLLDDVLSELDESRQLHLLQSMGERVQTLITTTTTYGLEPFLREKAHVYRVQAGVITKEGS
jgi:DNA replication and repair protein RecF